MIGNLTGLIPPLAIRDDHKYIMYSDMITEEVEASNIKVKIPNALLCDKNDSRKKCILFYLDRRAFSSNDCKNIRVDRNLSDALSGHLLFLIAFKNNVACIFTTSVNCLKKNQNAPKPSEHPPVRGKNKCQNVWVGFDFKLLANGLVTLVLSFVSTTIGISYV